MSSHFLDTVKTENEVLLRVGRGLNKIQIIPDWQDETNVKVELTGVFDIDDLLDISKSLAKVLTVAGT